MRFVRLGKLIKLTRLRKFIKLQNSHSPSPGFVHSNNFWARKLFGVDACKLGKKLKKEAFIREYHHELLNDVSAFELPMFL